MIPTLNRIIWNILLVAFLAAGFAACQKDPSDSEDLETWIVKNYFLPDGARATLESSFKLCGTNNQKAIDNLTFVYESKELDKIAEELITKKIEGNQNNDPRSKYISDQADIWYAEGKLERPKLAYEYALSQHRLYLIYTDSIKDKKIRAFYTMAKSRSIDGCLKDRMTEKAKSGQRPKKTYEELKKQKAKSKQGNGKEVISNNKDSNTKWVVAALFFVLLLVGRYIFGQFKNAGAHSYHPPDTNKGVQKTDQPVVTPMYLKIPEKVVGQTNTKSTWLQAPQDQPESSSSKESPKTIHEKIQQQIKEEASSNTITPHQANPLEQPNETKPKTPTLSPEQKKEAKQEKQIHIPSPPEPKKPDPTPNATTYGSSEQFARIPSGNLFFSFSPHPEYPDTPFIIDERTGTFDLAKDPQTLERLFSMIDQLKDACELMNINQPRLNTYDVRTKGKVVREGEYWRITKKLKLDW